MDGRSKVCDLFTRIKSIFYQANAYDNIGCFTCLLFNVVLRGAMAGVLPGGDAMWAPAFAPPVASRSELLASRRAETTFALQSRYNEWEVSNPVWARRLTGPEAAEALGYAGERVNKHASRREMIHERRKAQRQAAYASSGFDSATQKALSSFVPDALETSISRATADPSVAWVEAPDVKSRSQLRSERRTDNVVTLEAAVERNERNGIMGSEARVQRRIDQEIASLQQAPKGKSRHELLAERRRQRAELSLKAYDAYQPPKPPQFSDQPKPFWKVGKPEAAAPAPSSTDVADVPGAPAATSVDGGVQGAPGALPNGNISAEILNAQRRWWIKPETYPKVAPAQPRADDPFKLKSDDVSFMHRKLSSGPKKEQRGYPPDARPIAGKLTALPPPSLAEAINRRPFRQHSGAAFKFMPHEPRELAPNANDTNADGYEFTQPLYSSFAADRTFQPARLPPRPNARVAPAVRERSRPSTTTGARAEARSAPTSDVGGLAMAASEGRPGTAAFGFR